MSLRVDEVFEEALQLSPVEQLALIQRISESLVSKYEEGTGLTAGSEREKIPSWVKRTPPATNLADYAVDFWPDNESVDEFNAHVRQQRAALRSNAR